MRQTQKHSAVCGSLTETRTSRLLARPITLSGSFCLQGTEGFRLSYAEPVALTIIYHDGYVNVVHDRERRTEAFEAGSGVARVMRYFAPSASIEHIERDFRVSVEQARGSYVLRMEPLTGRFRSRVRLIVATFDAGDFRIRRLEINGHNEVTSVFDIRIERVDLPLDPAMFHVYRPRPGKEPQA